MNFNAVIKHMSVEDDIETISSSGNLYVLFIPL
jgi:hypothetical protein